LSDIATGLPRAAGDHLEENAMKAGSTRIFAGAGAAPSMRGTAALGGLFRHTGRDGAWVVLDNGLDVYAVACA
jgi:hypothetical protein